MGDQTHYVTTKFQGGGRTFISHLNLGATPSDVAVLAAITDFQLLTTNTQVEDVEVSGGHVVSVTQSIQRIMATEDIKEVQDLSIVNPHLMTGRLIFTDVGETPPKNYTLPWILRGVNPAATAPPTFSVAPGSNYETWVIEFLKKYARVRDNAPTTVIISKDTLMH